MDPPGRPPTAKSAVAARTLPRRIGIAGALAVLLGGCSGGQSAKPLAHGAGPALVLDRLAVAGVLDRQAQAVQTHDRTAFLATIDPAQKAYRDREGQVFDDLARLPIQGWRLSLDPVQPVPPTPQGVTARLTLRYRFAGFDTGDVTSTSYLTFARHGGWVVSGDGSPAGLRDDAQIWDEGPVTVARGGSSLVVGAGGGAALQARLQEVASRLDQAVPTVSAVVGQGWSRRAVALAPADDRQLNGLVGGGQNLREIAALATVTPDPGGPDHGQDRIIIAPDTFGTLNALGRHVVLTHELTHVATGGARDARTPIWLVEGLADYVGYKDTSVPVKEAAKELQGDLAAAGPPPALPDRDQFSGSSGKLPQAYEAAWLACRMIAERYGEPALVRLYRAAGQQDQNAALQSVLGLTTDQFTAQWRDYLRRQLS